MVVLVLVLTPVYCGSTSTTTNAYVLCTTTGTEYVYCASADTYALW